jgi:UDP-N-acetylmuramate--alanine ligase
MNGTARHGRSVAGDWTNVDLLELARTGPVHFVGIAGAGMSALAELLLRAGGRVSGSDLEPGTAGDALRALGAIVHEGHNGAYVQDAVAVVVTSAVPSTNPELEAARARGIPVLKRAQALGALVNRGTVIAIAGTHGKTTTTAMTTAILTEARLDPTAFVGGRVGGWGGGLRAGGHTLFVVEADEYDRSFLTLEPDVAVVTSIEADHLDVYGTASEVEAAFLEFVAAVPDDGLVAACVDDSGAERLVAAQPPGVALSYGTAASAALRALDVAPHGRGSRFGVTLRGARLGEITLAAPGMHNVRNALGALAAALHVGADFDTAARALAGFSGVARRFEVIGAVHDIVFVDDYAHHPTEVAATIAATRTVYPARRLVAVFQPHLYSRTRDFADAFGAALAAADVAWVTDVYAAREQPIEGVSGALVTAAALNAGASEVHYAATLDELGVRLPQALRAGDVCVAMGAGSIDRAVRAVHARLQEAGAP